MPRTIQVTIGGDAYLMPVTLDVSMQIAEHIGDPLLLADKIIRAGTSQFTQNEMVVLIHLGVQAGGFKIKREDLAAKMFDAGFVNYMAVCVDYIVAMSSGAPEVMPSAASSSKKKK